MQKTLVILVLLVINFLGLISICKAEEPEFKSFSADVINFIDFKGTKSKINEKFFVSKDRVRKISSVDMIVRDDKKMIWTLDASKKKYTEMPESSGQFIILFSNMGLTPKGKLVGTEAMNGQLADKYENDQLTSYYVHGTKVPLKVESDNGVIQTTREFSNIQIGEPPPNIFEIPAGYQKK